MEDNRFYNYIYLDPTKPGRYEYLIDNNVIRLEYEPFYVGKGTKKRYKQHKYGCSGRFMKYKMKSLLSKNIDPIVTILDYVSEVDSLTLEERLINTIGRRDLHKGPLCNLTDGGEKGFNRKLTKETKDKLSKINKNKTLSEEHKRKIGLANKVALKGKISNKRKAILQLDINKNIIKEWSSISEAEQVLNIGNIQRAIKMNYTTHNSKWRYK